MEIELEPRVKPLPFKVKGMSRESPLQKASQLLENDLRSHWSTATNTKEWLLLELDEPCLLSHIRIYNKSVLEWEISVGLRYKPEAFVKVRPRCEAPRRDMMYPMNYTPCRYVRISCLRGNPIAIFFIQLIGVSVPGLEPEFQPVVNYLLPQIISHKQDAHDMHLQLLQDMTSRLLVFLPQLEADLSSFSDADDSNLRFFAMLAGPFYPILQIVNERETTRSPGNSTECEISKNNQSSALTVSSNFEPRRSRNTSSIGFSSSTSIAFRPDAILQLLRKAYKDSDLRNVCRMASRVLQKLVEPVVVKDVPSSETADASDETSKSDFLELVQIVDYSSLFGEEFQLSDDQWDRRILSILDIGAVEEGILHVLYACASQSLFCSKLAADSSDFWSALPLVQALLPALRPFVNSHFDHVDEAFPLWKQAFVQQAISQIVLTSSSPSYHPLLHACAGYLSSFSPSHAKTACVLIDLCSGVLAPWMPQVIAKVDLAVELLEDLLGTIQCAHQSMARARAALKYIVLALSGHMDNMLGKYKEVKLKLLFLLEMLEPFLDPALYSFKSRVAFGNVSFNFPETQEQTCLIALNVIRTALQKPTVLPSLESEWRRGSVAPSVLLSILGPQMQLPPGIDSCKSPTSKSPEVEVVTIDSSSHQGGAINSYSQIDLNVKVDVIDTTNKMDVYEDVSLYFAPSELRTMPLTNTSSSPNEISPHSHNRDANFEKKLAFEENFSDQLRNGLLLDATFAAEYFNLQANYFHLVNFRDCELRASEFQQLAHDMHSQNEISNEGHDATIDALLLAAECYVNPFFVMSFGANSNITNQMKISRNDISKGNGNSESRSVTEKDNTDTETISYLEKKRDKMVLQILLEAAELDRNYKRNLSEGELCASYAEGSDEQVIELSPVDVQSADAVTLVRQNQALLCNFLIKQLQREQHSMHEILLHCLVFFLHSATKLLCAPEDVIDIILGSAEYLNGVLKSFHSQLKECSLQFNPEKVHGIQRRWMLLQRLIIVSSGNDFGSDLTVNNNNGFRHGNLIPPSAWMQRICTFANSAFPLVRFLGWMAISRIAKQFMEERFSLVSDLSQLTYLLSIYADELAVVDNAVYKKHEDVRTEPLGIEQDCSNSKGSESSDQKHEYQSFRVIYPDLGMFFPNMKKQFEAFGEIILESVGLQLRLLPPEVLPDILCWFSELCSWPFFQKDVTAWTNNTLLKGYVSKNAKAIILYVMEAIVTEHMEAMVPEIPRVVHMLVSLCRTSYCDVSFLESILRLLKPIISHSFSRVSDEEKLLVDGSCQNFESLCFEELFVNIRQRDDKDTSAEKVHNKALTIYILASVFPDLSFPRRREMLQSLALWADFPAIEPTTHFHDYLCAFQNLLDSCKVLLAQILWSFSLIPLTLPHLSETGDFCDQSTESQSWFLNDVLPGFEPTEVSEKRNSFISCSNISPQEMDKFIGDLEGFIKKLNLTIEQCWIFHHQLTRKLTITSAECFVYLRCLNSVTPITQNVVEAGSTNELPIESVNHYVVHWQNGLKGLADTILMLLENHCWDVASVVLDCLLGVPLFFKLDTVIGLICAGIKKISCSAPKIAWRFQTDRWLSLLFVKAVHRLQESDAHSMVDLFCSLLGHSEPEQRFIGLKHLSKLVRHDVDGGSIHCSAFCKDMVSPNSLSAPEAILSILISSTWDQVIVLASSDTSLPLRNCAMTLLVNAIRYATRQQLQSFLGAAHNVLYGFGKLARPVCEGSLLKLSLALIASACLYSPAEDINLIPQNVWKDIETLSASKTEVRLGDTERKVCQVLCRLRNEGDEVKEELKSAFSSNSTKQYDPDFVSTRDSILQVLSDLTSVQSYFTIFKEKIDIDSMAMEEAELELNIIQKEHTQKELSKDTREEQNISFSANLQFVDSASVKDVNRLQQIKDSIHALEKSKLQKDIIARRQKKLLMRHDRQKLLEAEALREAELLRELDRERSAEVEKEIERQRALENERAKTRELRHHFEMEKERQTQRELQKELEQAESGLRSSRRDFSSSHNRYREREGNGRGSGGSLQHESSSMTIPTVVLSSSARPFTGQPPIILQSRDRERERERERERDRVDECGSSYEENLDGSKDSGDTGSVGDAELMSTLDVQFGSRQGSRGSSKSRQAIERRERDRREGKWERKH